MESHLDKPLTWYKHPHSKWIKGQNRGPEPLKMVEEKGEEIFQDTGTDEDFLNRTWVTKEIKQILTNRTS